MPISSSNKAEQAQATPLTGVNELGGKMLPPGVQVLAGKPSMPVESDDLCIVLHGYGKVRHDEMYYVDNYKFIGGVGRNIPRSIAQCWAKGTRPDGKPAISRIFPQAILPSDLGDAEEAVFAQATGIRPMEPGKLAAMINAVDAKDLVDAMGRQQAVALAEKLLQNSAK